MVRVDYQHVETGNMFYRYYLNEESIEIFPRYFIYNKEYIKENDIMPEETVETCSIDYEEEYYRQCEYIKRLTDENEKLKEGLLKLALKL